MYIYIYIYIYIYNINTTGWELFFYISFIDNKLLIVYRTI